MDLLNEFITNIIIVELLIILLLFLRELGFTTYIYEETITNPYTRNLVKYFGDVLYMVGGSVIGAVIYTFYTTSLGFQFIPTFIGVFLIIVGAYLRDSKKK